MNSFTAYSGIYSLPDGLRVLTVNEVIAIYFACIWQFIHCHQTSSDLQLKTHGYCNVYYLPNRLRRLMTSLTVSETPFQVNRLSSAALLVLLCTL